jgi:hypothetical protein
MENPDDRKRSGHSDVSPISAIRDIRGQTSENTANTKFAFIRARPPGYVKRCWRVHSRLKFRL